MLERIGAGSVDELLTAIPQDARRPKLGLAPGMSEQEVQSHLEKLAAMNRTAGSGPFFIGGAIQRRYIPAAVPVLALRGEFLTAYTPYQPEVSQGTLQAVFEYQSLMAELLGMDVVNSSMYDGSSATAEAVLMAVRLTGRKKVVLATEVDFTNRRTVRTYARGPELDIVEVATSELAANAEGAACLVVQHPDAFGTLVDVKAIADAAHAAGALLVQVTEPHACALLEPPGALGADIAVGEGQPLGIAMSYGGPHLGNLPCPGGRAPRLRDLERRSLLRSLHAAQRARRVGAAQRVARARDPGRGDGIALCRWTPRGARRRDRAVHRDDHGRRCRRARRRRGAA